MKKSIFAVSILVGAALVSTSALAEESAFSVGIGSYGLSIKYPTVTDTLTGPALNLNLNFNRFVSLGSHIYALQHDTISTLEMNGYDILIRGGLVGSGINVAASAGAWSETLSQPSINNATADFSGTCLGVSLGYSWESFTILADMTRRTIKDYQGTSSGNVDAATTAINLSYRF